MRKISLKNLNLNEVEQLSREQLKSVLGGISGSGGSFHCNSDDDCPSDKKCDTSKNLCWNNSTIYAVPCTGSVGTACVTRDGVTGICDYHGGIYGCG